ncbi:uncharacterized protein LOC111780123 [Cucurbita pepo subsp. pepo]|uniref:uncharacterized protein LOC111780123 n=1 Tax=Cucurbita pepo subsp. pepo TaxID=3664 RepID=UPI000C9D4695|nr:uncharacterized protein LOC111780123 [Cucurbita pepo subsp. pepo]XP_023516185.1 uncharacterized protein LOC111780123 [Cucurbita pepo subsp. pepo]
MPLDGVKSVVYRSFITCDDPKGVVDCNIFKISKVNSKNLERKVRGRRRSRNPNKVLVSQVEKEELISNEKDGQSSLPFMEVCQGAEKLNHMVGSWSNGMRSDRKTEEIAEELLEGTSSFRESLIMLAKLQETSNESVQLKTTYQKSFSCHLEDESFPVEVQRSKLSIHGSSRNGPDEVKKVIRDNLVRRDTKRNVAVGEESCFHDINFDSGSEIPSTSSSKSSLISDNVNCCHVSTSGQKNLKRNNLIAKLMGLEEISSRSLQTTPKEGTLREILEKMPFNRLIESDPDKEFKLPGSHSYNHYGSKQRLENVLPIVLIKHKPLPPNVFKEHRAHVSSNEDVFNQQATLRSMKKKELQGFDRFDFHRGSLSSDKSCRRQEAEGKMPKHKEVMKLRKGTVDAKKKAAEKLKRCSPMPDMPHEKEPIHKKILTSKKLTTKEKVVSRPQHEEKVSSTNPRKNRTHKQRSPIPDSKPGRAVRPISNDRDCQKKEAAVPARSEVNSFTHMVEAKKDHDNTDTNESANLPINQYSTTLMALASIEKEIDECDTKIIECCKESPNSHSLLSPKLEINKSIDEAIDPNSHTETDIEINTSIVEDIDPNSHTETDIESCDQGTNLKALLLRSSSFLFHVGELFDLNLNGRTMVQAASRCNDPEEAPNTKPFIDCAIEIVKRKGHDDLQVANSLLLGDRCKTKTEISVEKLVKEVSDDIDTLTSYQTIQGDSVVVDTVYAVLSRDLWCKEVMNGMWGFGWKNGSSRSEREEVVNDIEKLILSGLIEESFT